MTDPHAEARRIAREATETVLTGPSRARVTHGEWYEKCRTLGFAFHDLSAREERLRELLLALLDGGVIRSQWAKRIRAVLSEADDDHARAEHLREAREVEAWQEAKHARREEGAP